MSNTQNILNGLDLREPTEKSFRGISTVPRMPPANRLDLVADNAELRAKLAKAEDMLRSIRRGESDALVMQSAERVRLATEAAQLGFWSWEPNEDIVAWENEYPHQILGVGPSEPSIEAARFAAEFVIPEDVAALQQVMARTVEAGEPLIFTGRIRRRDGQTRWVEIKGRWGPPGGNRAARVIGTIQDITDHKSAEAKLRTSEIRYRRLFEAAHDGVLILDPDTRRIVDANPFMTALLGYPRDRLIGMELYQIGFHTDAQASRDMFEALTATSQVRYEDLPLQTQKGGLREVEVVANLYDENGRPVVQCNVRDITDRRRAEEALRASEARLSRILSQSPAGIVQTDAGGRMLLVNERWCEMLGYSETEMLGMTVIDVTHPNSVQATLESVGRLAKGGPDFQIDKNYRRKDGTMLQVNSNVAALRDVQGNYQGLLAVVLDMTKRLDDQDRLRASEQRFRGIFDSTFQFIGLLSPDGMLLEANQTALEFAGLAADDVVGRPFWEARWWAAAPMPGTPAQLQAAIAEAATGKFVRYEVEVRGVGERTIFLDFSLRPVLDANGHVALLVPEGRDITERKRQEEHIKLLMGEVNHRSKNMLTVVQAIAKKTIATQPEDFIERFGQRVQALAANQDLLVKSEWKSVALDDLVRSQLAHFGDARDNRVALDGPPVEIKASASQALGMALHELATNAAKYGALSNEVGRVAISWNLRSDASGKARLTMSWVESGGPPVARPTRQGFGSTVTGSMIKISLNCDAEINFAPTGLVWRIDCLAAGLIEGSALSAPQSNGAALKNPAQASGRRRVLVVEDDPLIAMEIAAILSDAGFTVVGPAGSVAHALALIERSGCEAAVLDINLGDVTSEPIARVLSASATPFVTTSGYSREQQPAAFRNAPLVSKPLRPELLVAEIRKCFGKAH